jgi:hypothetical protein
MSAVFRVHASFDLPSRRVFVLRGEILSGEVRRGMVLHMPLNSGFAATTPIGAVEMIDGAGFGQARIALLIPYEDRAEQEFIEDWASIGEELLVADPERP